jgi:quinol-cytochrome oxidoreductase complex cytochrome b subunit
VIVFSPSAWIRARVPISGEQLRELTNEPVPNHMKRWWWCLGGTPAYLFVVQIVTGILLAFYYSPRRRPPTSRCASSPSERLSAGTCAACTSGPRR